jgi:hypothetical protein
MFFDLRKWRLVHFSVYIAQRGVQNSTLGRGWIDFAGVALCRATRPTRILQTLVLVRTVVRSGDTHSSGCGRGVPGAR